MINPTQEQEELSDLDLTVAGTANAVMMVEAGANEVDEEIIWKGLCLLMTKLKICAIQEETAKIGKEKAGCKFSYQIQKLKSWVEAIWNQDKLTEVLQVADKLT